jgi:endonuclease YncB( thermonuclease family)
LILLAIIVKKRSTGYNDGRINMGIEDRDYMHQRPLRWDEDRGERRHENPDARCGSSRAPWGMIAIVAIVAMALIVLGAGGWWTWAARPAVSLETSVAKAVAPASTVPGTETWAPDGPVLVGRVTSVTDGDSVKVELSSGPIEVRLHSIDTPERNQPWGDEAKSALAQRLRGAEVRLEPIEQDQYGRMIAVVYLGDENVNAWLVREGHAWVYRQYARDVRYCEAEGAARAEQRGLWALPVSEQRAPWEWRAVQGKRREGFSEYSGETVSTCVTALGKRPAPGYRRSPAGHAVDPSVEARSRLSVPRDGPAEDLQHPHDAAAPETLTTLPSMDAAASGCQIKGNIGSSGKIYHVPGSQAYEKTKIDEARGERWFCSEDQAVAAGWRAPRG